MIGRVGRGGRMAPAARGALAAAMARRGIRPEPITPPVSLMPKGAKQSPTGDIGKYRQEESVKLGGFTAGACVEASRRLPMRKGK